jgi:Tfp pilus assembly protein PilV
MTHSRFLRREQGFTLVEVAASTFVLAVSVAGLVVSVCYGRQLERSTSTMCRATSAATATMEQIRSDSLQQWPSLPTNWDGTTGATAQVDDPIGAKLTTTVTSDASTLDTATGMWNSGATVPNFYFVEVTPSSAATDLSKSLTFQTYVANRGALVTSGQAAGSGSSGGGSTDATSTFTTATTSAGNISTTPVNVTLSGSYDNTVSFGLSNTSATNQVLTAIKVTAPGGVNLTNLRFNSTSLYTNTKGTTSVNVTTMTTLLPAGISPGSFTLQMGTTSTSLSGKKLTVQLTFKDKSIAGTTVTP